MYAIAYGNTYHYDAEHYQTLAADCAVAADMERSIGDFAGMVDACEYQRIGRKWSAVARDKMGLVESDYDV